MPEPLVDLLVASAIGLALGQLNGGAAVSVATCTVLSLVYVTVTTHPAV